MKYGLLMFMFVVGKIYSQSPVSKVWVADNGDGTYKNPVINADYSDPDAIRVGDDFYMIASSFTQIPGLPILHSKDLVNWKLIGHALKKQPPYDVYEKVQHGAGVWAPSIRYHNNEFYIYYPDPDYGIYLVKAKKINGPWTEPKLVESGKGLIDPCPLWDDDGKAYMVHAYAGSRAGIKSIIVVKEMNKEGTNIIGDPVMVYDGHDIDPTIEGPKFYKRNGYYYIFAPAGGVSTGWQTVLRSKKVFGPYERKIVMEQGETKINGPHQGAWVTTLSGESWFLHFQDREAYGRVVHIQPMKWKNDWPIIGEDKDNDGKGVPVTTYKKPDVGKTYTISTVQDSEEFNQFKFGLQWQWQANPKEGWAYPTSHGSLRMFSVYQDDSLQNLWNVPNILAQKLPAEEFQATLKVVFKPKYDKEQFGLVVFGTDYAYISLERSDDRIFIECRSNNNADKGGNEIEEASFPVKGDTFYLAVFMQHNGTFRFGFSDNEERFTDIPKLYTAKPGRWVGAKIGMFCTRNNKTNDAGYADIDWFRIEKLK